MECTIMFISHFFKIAHYWLTVIAAPELHPEIAYLELIEFILSPLKAIPEMITEYLPAATEAFFWQTAKIVEIYLSL